MSNFTLDINARLEESFSPTDLRKNSDAPSEWIERFDEHRDFPNILKASLPDYLSDFLELNKKEAEQRTEQVLNTLSFEFEQESEMETIARDAYSHAHGHGTEPDGVGITLNTSVRIDFGDDATVQALGLNRDELTEVLTDVASEMRMDSNHDVELALSDNLQQSLQRVKQADHHKMEQSFIVLPKTMPDIISHNDFKGVPPMRSVANAQIVGFGITTVPLYDADPSDFLPDTLKVLPYPQGKQELLSAAFEVISARDTPSPFLNSYNPLKTPGDFNRLAGQILKTLKTSSNRENIGNVIQAHVNALTPSADSQIQLAALTTLAASRLNDTDRLAALLNPDTPALNLSGSVNAQVDDLKQTFAHYGFKGAMTQFQALKPQQTKVLMDTIAFPPKPDAPEDPSLHNKQKIR